MKRRLASYLEARLDQPLAWLIVFGCCGVIGGASAAFKDEGLSGAVLAAAVLGAAGAVAGLAVGSLVWLIARSVGGLDRPVQRPDRWARPLICDSCGWHTTADGPWRVRDCLTPPTQCPACRHPLRMVAPACPACGAPCGGLIRRPRNLRQALWGGYTCAACSCEYDKWGRRVTGDASAE